MSTILINQTWASVPSAFAEIAPATLVGQFVHQFGAGGPQEAIYIRPGELDQQDLLNGDGAEWLLYTRSVMSYFIEWFDLATAVGGASLIVESMAVEIAEPIDVLPLHIVGGDQMVSHASGIELPGLIARFKIQTASQTACTVKGVIVMRAV